MKACIKVLAKTAIDETTVAMLSSAKTQINKPQHWRIQGGGLSGLQPSLLEVFLNLSGYPCLSLFHTKNNIISYNLSFGPIGHYKKTFAIPLLELTPYLSKCKIDFLTKIATPTICFVSCHRL